jgi:hypothetical protein
MWRVDIFQKGVLSFSCTHLATNTLSLSLSLSLSLERGCLAKRNAEVMLILFYFPKKKTQKLFCAGVSRSSSPSTRMSWPNSTLTAYLFLKGISMLNESLQAETLNLKP